METSFDRIAKGDKVWHTLCLECHSGINLLSEKIAKDHRESMRIDQYHTYIIGKYGPVIRCDKEGETSFLSVKTVKPSLSQKLSQFMLVTRFPDQE